MSDAQDFSKGDRVVVHIRMSSGMQDRPGVIAHRPRGLKTVSVLLDGLKSAARYDVSFITRERRPHSSSGTL